MPYTLITPPPDHSVVKAARVTEVIKEVLAAPAIHEWEVREAMKFGALSHEIVRSTPASALAAFRRENRKAADRGTAVHQWIAAILTDQLLPVLPVTLKGYSLAFTNWLGDNFDAVKPLHVEQTLTTAWFDFDVAGTADMIAERSGVRTVYDWKTVTKLTDRPYTDQLVQVAAYATMTQLVKGAAKRITPQPVPWCDEARIVQLAPNGQYREHVVTGPKLNNALFLWRSIRVVHSNLATIKIANKGE